MKHAVRHIHFVGVVVLSREQGSRLRDAIVREGRRMPKAAEPTGVERP
jgi:hypothetical protein